MAIQEVSRTGWFGRIGNSIKGILVGLVLLVVSLAVLVLNERNAVKDIRANKEIAKKVVSIGNDAVNPAHEGQLVHLNGPSQTGDILKNEKFGIAENAIRIEWNARIYQWVEEKRTKTDKELGGGERTVTTYHYEKKWVASPVDSSRFKEAGHQNTGKKNFRSGMAEAGRVEVGAFKLPPKLIAQIRSSEPYPLKTLPPALASAGSLTGGVFHTGDLNVPRIGDEKVEFSLTRPGEVSVMAVQSGDTFSPYQTKSGKTKFLLYEGLLSAEEVVAGEEQKAKMLRWILRGAGVVAMFIGFSLLLRPLSVLADVIPLFGSLVGGATAVASLLLALGISSLIIALSWVAFRPLLGIPLLALGIGCFVLVFLQLRKGKRTAPAAA